MPASHRWSSAYDACTACGSTEFRHAARGECTRCYRRGRPWSRNNAACVQCGSADSPHAAKGVCKKCYGTGESIQAQDPVYTRLTVVTCTATEGGASKRVC
jgi:hypothetical protein